MDGGLWECFDYFYFKMGCGGVKVVIKFCNMESGLIVDCIFNSIEKLQDIYVEGKKMQYLYFDGDDYVFMDMEIFDQVYFGKNIVSDVVKFMKENIEVEVVMYGDKVLSISLFNQVIFKIIQIDFGVCGDIVLGGIKFVILEIGVVVQVFLFVEQGIDVKVDICIGQYFSCV